MSNSRRNFLKKSALTIFGFSLFSKLQSSPPLVADCITTTKDYFGIGPYYTANAPLINNGLLANNSEVGTKIKISGKIKNIDCSEIIANAKIEIWHADNDGNYDNSGFNLRGIIFSDENGFYEFETIMPGKYLNGSNYRPSHIHFKVTPQDSQSFVTQLYFYGDTSISTDASASITSGEFNASNRIIHLSDDGTGKKIGYWEIIIDAESVSTSNNDLHIEKGLIYNVNPNPIVDNLEVEIGVFKKSKVKLQIVNLEGKEIETLVDEVLIPNKYKFKWNTSRKVSSGMYYVILKINSLQVSYKRIFKE